MKQRKLKDESQLKDIRKKSLTNTSGASVLYVGRMSSKDRRLLKMILVIFASFLACYLPITLSKVSRSISSIHFIFIMSYVLVYLTTCINPVSFAKMTDEIWNPIFYKNIIQQMIYVVMSQEYRQAYKNVLMCRNDSKGSLGKSRDSRRRIWSSSAELTLTVNL